MGFFDGLPISREKAYLREELSRIDESWCAARFDSLPHVVHILTSKDREGEVQVLKEQSNVIEKLWMKWCMLIIVASTKQFKIIPRF